MFLLERSVSFTFDSKAFFEEGFFSWGLFFDKQASFLDVRLWFSILVYWFRYSRQIHFWLNHSFLRFQCWLLNYDDGFCSFLALSFRAFVKFVQLPSTQVGHALHSLAFRWQLLLGLFVWLVRFWTKCTIFYLFFKSLSANLLLCPLDSFILDSVDFVESSHSLIPWSVAVKEVFFETLAYIFGCFCDSRFEVLRPTVFFKAECHTVERFDNCVCLIKPCSFPYR